MNQAAPFIVLLALSCDLPLEAARVRTNVAPPVEGRPAKDPELDSATLEEKLSSDWDKTPADPMTDSFLISELASLGQGSEPANTLTGFGASTPALDSPTGGAPRLQPQPRVRSVSAPPERKLDHTLPRDGYLPSHREYLRRVDEVKQWTDGNVASWLESVGLSDLAEEFIGVGGEALLGLDREALVDMGVPGRRQKSVLRALRVLEAQLHNLSVRGRPILELYIEAAPGTGMRWDDEVLLSREVADAKRVASEEKKAAGKPPKMDSLPKLTQAWTKALNTVDLNFCQHLWRGGGGCEWIAFIPEIKRELRSLKFRAKRGGPNYVSFGDWNVPSNELTDKITQTGGLSVFEAHDPNDDDTFVKFQGRWNQVRGIVYDVKLVAAGLGQGKA